MRDDHDTTSIRVTSDAEGARVITITGVLDDEAVTAVLTAVEHAKEAGARFVLDLLGVNAYDRACVARLARALGELGATVDVVPHTDEPGPGPADRP